MQRDIPWRSPEQKLALGHIQQQKWLYFHAKRGMDLILSLLFLILTFPLFLLIALLIKLDSPGPVFFKQERVGLRKRSTGDGRGWELSIFPMYKFRTMQHNCSPDIHQRFVEALINGDKTASLRNNGDSEVNKLNNDPRVTGVGKVLRKTHLDELPQFLNVLRGEMSLVGPRPPIPYEIAAYKPRHWKRLEAISGCTGYWQVRGWNTLTFEEMVELDIWYIEHQSLGLDAKILLQTVPAVLSGKGGG